MAPVISFAAFIPPTTLGWVWADPNRKGAVFPLVKGCNNLPDGIAGKVSSIELIFDRDNDFVSVCSIYRTKDCDPGSKMLNFYGSSVMNLDGSDFVLDKSYDDLIVSVSCFATKFSAGWPF